MDASETHRTRRGRGVSLVWPLILITAGALVLLSYLGWIDVNLWQLWRLWPVLLILAGLELLLSRVPLVGRLLTLVIAIVVIGGLVFVLVASPGTLGGARDGGVDFVKEPLEGIERAALALEMAAGDLELRSVQEPLSLFDATLRLRTGRKPTWEIERSGSRADMALKDRGVGVWAWGQGDEWDIGLSPQVGFDLDVDLGAGQASVDLTGLDIRELNVDVGAGQATVVFPGQGTFDAQVNGGVGQLVLEIPDSLAVRLRVDRGLSALSVSSRYERDGDVYVTSDWERRADRVEIELDMGVGQVVIREP